MKISRRSFLKIVGVSAAAMGLAACGGTASSGSSAGASASGSAASGSYDKVVYSYSTFNNVPAAEDLATVQEAINAITREKIGVEVELMPLAISDYVNKVSLSLQGGEQIDIFESLGNFNSCVSSDMCCDLTDLMDADAPDAKSIVGDDFLNACKVNGKLYGIPTYKPYALTPMLIYRTDIADELGLDIDSLTGVEGVTAIAEAVKKGKPEITPLAPVQSGTIGLNMCMGDVDWLSDDMYSPVGVLMNDEMTVKDLYASDVFKSVSEMARNWYNESLIMQDSATTTTMASEAMASGNYFGYIAAYSYPEADTAASLAAQLGTFPVGAKIIADAYLCTGDINAVSWMIASTSKVPDAALKFLNLTYSDDEIINLLIYGIEGRDYVQVGDGTVKYPDGQDSTTVPYTAQLSCGTLGNFFKMFPMQGTDPASLTWEEQQNKDAKKSPAMGFTFDSSTLKTQYTAVKNVLSQYLPGLLCGSLDPATELDKFEQALKDAGYQDILDEKQKQLDSWKAAN